MAEAQLWSCAGPARRWGLLCGAVEGRPAWAWDVLQERAGGGGLAQGLGICLFAFGGAYWPLATAHSDPLWARTCFGCVNRAPG